MTRYRSSEPGPAAHYRTLKLCSHGGGYEALPDRPTRLDLPRAREILEAAGLPVIDARVMLIATLPPEVTVSQAGRVLIKTREEPEAAAAFERLAGLLHFSRQ
jgi:hypothetical protein